MVDAFKSLSTVEYIRGVKNKGWLPFDKKFWQRNYYEHIIRNENAYLQIVEYIQANPLRWENKRIADDAQTEASRQKLTGGEPQSFGATDTTWS